jgi:nucleoside-diphosphate-sugar epimerase
MKVLYIGGTGNISTASSKLAIKQGIDLWHLNRGTTKIDLPGVKTITANIYKPDEARNALKDHTWDVVVNWIAYIPDHIKTDVQLFGAKTKQYIFISSASVYQKPPTHPIITESTPLYNPFWAYSRDKIDCENLLIQEYQQHDFPVTIVRPSHTYNTTIPLTIGGWTEYTAVHRMKTGQKVIIQGDGTSLWTLTHADDFAKGFNGLLGNIRSIGHPVHITSDEVLSWNQIYQAVADAAGAELNAVHVTSDFITKIAPGEKDGLWGDKSHCAIFDNTKIKNLVPGFTATIPFSEGIKRTLAWFEANPKRMVVNPKTNAMIDRVITAYEKLS